MDSKDGSEITWFAKEAGVYYRVFWLPPGLLLLQLVLGWVAGLLGVVGVILLFVLPYILLFLTIIFTAWGLALICLGFKKQANVRPMISATLICSSPLIVAAGLWLWSSF